MGCQAQLGKDSQKAIRTGLEIRAHLRMPGASGQKTMHQIKVQLLQRSKNIRLPTSLVLRPRELPASANLQFEEVGSIVKTAKYQGHLPPL